MADVNSLYNNGAGSIASLFAGQNQADDRAYKGATLQQLQMQNQQAAIDNPLNNEFKRAQIAQMQSQTANSQATLPGIMGQSQSSAAQGQYDTQMIGTKIAGALEEHKTKIGGEKMKQYATEGERMGMVSDALSKLSPQVHKKAYAEVMQKMGGDIKDPLIQRIMALPDAQFLPALRATGIGMALAGNKYIQEQASATQQQGSSERIASGNNATQLEIAQIQAQSREQAALIKAQQVAQTVGIDKGIAILEMKGEQRTDEEDQILENLKRQALQQRAAGANALGANIMDEKNQMDAAAEAAKGSKPRASAQPDNNIAAIAKKQGVEYDTTNYDYRLVDGVVQRKKK